MRRRELKNDEMEEEVAPPVGVSDAPTDVTPHPPAPRTLLPPAPSSLLPPPLPSLPCTNGPLGYPLLPVFLPSTFPPAHFIF